MSLIYQVRPACSEDHELFAYFFRELGISDPVPSLERWRHHMAPTAFFLESGGQTLGYAFYEVFEQDGFVRHVVSAPTARGRGVGRALMRELAQRLLRAGCLRWQLHVRTDNEPALRLYRTCGMEKDYPTTVVRLSWQAIALLPPSKTGVFVRPVLLARDTLLERSFRQPMGRLRKARERAEVHVLELVDADEQTHGLAIFDKTFPGCYPFLLRDEFLARALLEGMLPLRCPNTPWLQLVIEDNELLAEHFLARGATLVLRISHLAGPLTEAVLAGI